MKTLGGWWGGVLLGSVIFDLVVIGIVGARHSAASLIFLAIAGCAASTSLGRNLERARQKREGGIAPRSAAP